MNTEKSNRFLKIIVVLLIVVNAMVLVMHFKSMGMLPKRPHGSQLKFRLIEELNMDEKQESQYSEMVDRHRASMNEIKKMEEETRIKLYDELGNIHLNRDTLFDKMALLRREREVITFNHFIELRAILYPEQATQFDEIIGEAVNGMEGPPGKNPR